jgi:hypothetical protein
MARNNRLTEQVFTGLDPEKFLSTDEFLGITETPEITKAKELYRKLLEHITPSITALVTLEETLVQLRCREMIKENIKLSFIRDYIYARSLFYRSGNEVKDIRVIVGRISEYGDDPDVLLNDHVFMGLARFKIEDAMDDEINSVILSDLQESVK